MPTLLDNFLEYATARGISDTSYIVGGTVRDFVLNKEIRDLDIAVMGDAVSLAHEFADSVGASFVLLDKTFGIARVVSAGMYLDICKMRGDSICDDLGDRDLTINAMAMPLSAFIPLNTDAGGHIPKKAIIDPFNGLDDIENGVIRMISRENLASDPLRLLRVYRFASTLGFSLEEATKAAVHSMHDLIVSSAPERISEELRQILRSFNSAATLKDMQSSGLLLAILPELADNSQETWRDIWFAYEYAEHMLAHLSDSFPGSSGPVAAYFEMPHRSGCIKLSLLLKDPGLAEQAACRLRLSGKETAFIRLLFDCRENRSLLDHTEKSGVISLLRQVGDDIYSALILMLALKKAGEQSGMPNLPAAIDIIKLYHKEYLPRKSRLPLISGHDLIQKFSLSPSPFLGQILSDIELLALEGILTSREEALRAAGDMIKDG